MKTIRLLYIFAPYVVFSLVCVIGMTIVFSKLFGARYHAWLDAFVFIVAMYVGVVLPIGKINIEKSRENQANGGG